MFKLLREFVAMPDTDSVEAKSIQGKVLDAVDRLSDHVAKVYGAARKESKASGNDKHKESGKTESDSPPVTSAEPPTTPAPLKETTPSTALVPTGVQGTGRRQRRQKL